MIIYTNQIYLYTVYINMTYINISHIYIYISCIHIHNMYRYIYIYSTTTFIYPCQVRIILVCSRQIILSSPWTTAWGRDSLRIEAMIFPLKTDPRCLRTFPQATFENTTGATTRHFFHHQWHSGLWKSGDFYGAFFHRSLSIPHK